MIVAECVSDNRAAELNLVTVDSQMPRWSLVGAIKMKRYVVKCRQTAMHDRDQI